MLVDVSILVVSASLGYMVAKSRLGQRKSQEPSDRSKLRFDVFWLFRIASQSAVRKADRPQTSADCLSNLVAIVAIGRHYPPLVWQRQTSVQRFQNLDATPASEITASAVKMALQRHSLKTGAARIELAQIRADFVFGRISEALFASRPFHLQAETTKIDISTNIAD